jgi:hypothetical protein
MTATNEVPTPVETDVRCAIAVYWYATEAEAEAMAAIMKAEGRTYVGGWNHGALCGRDKGFDYTTKDGQRLYAVTD